MKLYGDLKEIKSIQKSSTNRKYFPKEIYDCVNLEILNFAYNYLTEMPSELAQLTKLEHIDYQSNKLELLPPNIGEFRALKKLNLANNQLKELPVSIGELENLEFLVLGNNQLTALPPTIGNCKNLRYLSLMGNQVSELPEELFELENLEFLGLHRNPITHLSPKIGQLKKLKKLYIGQMELAELPAEIKACAHLEELVMYRNKLRTLPAFLTQLPALTFLNVQGNPFDGFQENALYFLNLNRMVAGTPIYSELMNANEWNELLAFFAKKNVPLEMRAAAYEAFVGKNEKLSEKYSREEIATILAMGNDRAFENARKYLQSPSLKERPLKAGDEVAMFGRAIFTRKEIKEKLENLQAKLSSKVTKNTTHVLLGKHSKYVKGLGKEGLVFVTDVELQAFFNEVEDAFLLEENVQESGFIEQVEALLKSGDEDNVAVALQMLRGGGLPKDLIPNVFISYFLGTSRSNRAEAKKLLKLYGDEKMQVAMTRKYKKFEPNKMAYFLRRNIAEHARISGVPDWQIAEAVYERHQRCKDILLESEHITNARKIELLQTIYQSKRLNLHYMSLHKFPVEIYELEDMETLIAAHHSFRELPSGISRLKKLQQLYVGFTPISTFPDDLAKLDQLNYIDMKHTGFSVFPEVLTKLPNLKRLNVGGLLDRRKGFEISNLQKKLPGVIII